MKAKQKKDKVFILRITQAEHKTLKAISRVKQKSKSAVIRQMISRARGQLKVE